MQDQLNQIALSPPAVRVSQSGEQAQLRFLCAFEHLKEQFLNCVVLGKGIRQEFDKRLNEARTGIDRKARGNLLNDRNHLMIVQRLQHLDLYNLLDDLKILPKHFLVIFYLLSGFDAVGALVLEAAVDVVVLIDEEVDDVFDAEDIQAVLDLLCIDSLY